MATVRFSDSLKHEIRKNIQVMFEDSITKAKVPPQHWADKFYECFFPASVREQMNALPDYVLSMQEGIALSGFHNAPDDVYQTSCHKQQTWSCDSVELKFSAPKRWPSNTPVNIMGYKMNWRNGTADYNDSRWDWLKPEFKEYTRKIFEANNKHQTFLESVNRLMETYTTLAPALKAWRPLWDLLPEDAKERHKAVKERKVVKAEELDLDLNAMTSAVALNKLTR